MQRLEFFGIFFSPSLVCLGFFLVHLRKLFLGGMGRLWVKLVKNLANDPLMYILDSIEGKEFASVK